ncbi:hypothetical protein [Shewanella violacea]|uniref:KfrA N-terminal DNA-binding domain-containing protein n=1 Tax=Shewanella violacea (strain JCM 10179 / CIP 106290 / LMG 19151 / DSS12) TaxID=637905 RepID=D4ZHN6_SHEVD|nr:hypothetical protein [Shewanella violacea]BAJ01185.1 conserved hypothetical protein [Shewanella violacea DSS12]
MNPLEQVLAAAKLLMISGKKPSLALIKTKLGNGIPMPILIQGLQQFKAMDTDSVEKIPSLNELHTAAILDEDNSEFNQLKTELAQLKQAYQNLNTRLEKLENDKSKAQK